VKDFHYINQNRFVAAVRVLMGKGIVRVTFPDGYYHLHGMLIVEGSSRSLQVLGASAATLPDSLPQMRQRAEEG
jgi:hypothetical protein